MKQKGFSSLIFMLMVLSPVFFLPGCTQESADNSELEIDDTLLTQIQTGRNRNIQPAQETVSDDLQINLDKSRYLFDVTEHSVEDLLSLLNRIDEIAESGQAGYEELDIVMILHGPDINMFTYQNYDENKPLVDLAAKLDAFNIIDMKVCETSLPVVGVLRQDIPPFIESVPYAPTEKKRLTNEGYINL